jgi:formate dehydrogenase subunit gamma
MRDASTGSVATGKPDSRGGQSPRVHSHVRSDEEAVAGERGSVRPLPRAAGQAPGRTAAVCEARRSFQAALPVTERPVSPEELFSREIPRFRRSERSLHWAIAVPFLLCLVSGVFLKLFFNVLHSDLVAHAVLLWVHRFSGVLLILLPTWVAWRHRSDLSLYLYNVKRAWSWTADDLKWLALVGLASLSKKIALPEQHKFNAGEKINFMVLMLTYPMLVATGVLLLVPGIQFLSFIVHVIVAVLAAPLIIGHLYMAVVNPETRIGLSGMFSGNVDREWAKHHYAKWYREHHGEDERPPTVASAPPGGLAGGVASASANADKPTNAQAMRAADVGGIEFSFTEKEVRKALFEHAPDWLPEEARKQWAKGEIGIAGLFDMIPHWIDPEEAVRDLRDAEVRTYAQLRLGNPIDDLR